MTIGMGQPGGFIEVPDDISIRNMPAGFISTICCARAEAPGRHSNKKVMVPFKKRLLKN